jgi:WD40 repeat protein
MFTFKSLLRLLAVWFGIVAILSMGSASSFAAEKPEIFVQLGHSGNVFAVAFSPDGKYLLSGSDDKTLKLWEVSTGREIRTLWHTEGVMSVAFSPDGKYILSGSRDGTMKLWDLATGKEIKAFSIDVWRSVVFSPDDRYVAAGSDKVTIYDVKSGKAIKILKGHTGPISSMAFSPDGRYLVSGSEWVEGKKSKDNTVRLWDVETGKEIKRFTGHTKGVMSVAFSPDGEYVASGSEDKTVVMWHIKSGKKIKTFTNPQRYERFSIAFSPDGKRLIVSGLSEMELWDVSTSQVIATLKGNHTDPWAVIFSPDGRHVAVSAGNAVALWDTAFGAEVRKFGGYVNWVNFAYFSADGRKIHSASISGSASTVDLLNGNIINKEGADGSYLDNRFFRQTDAASNYLSIVDSKTGKEVMKINLTEAANNFIYRVLAFSDDGRVALLADNGWKKVTTFDIDKKKNITTLESLEAVSLRGAAFSPNGQNVVTYSPADGNSLTRWNVFTGKQLKTFKGHTNIITKIKYTSDGKYMLSGSMDNTLKLWNPQTGKEIMSFGGHSAHDGIEAIEFSPDDKYILSGSWDGTMKLWDLATGKELQTFRGHTNRVQSVAFSPDSKYALSGSHDGTTRLWNIDTGKEIAQFISFTDGEWVIITPEGYFNASPNGAKHLNVRVGNNVYSIDNFYEKFFNPVYVASVLQGKKVEAVADIRKGILTPPDVKITSPEPNKEFSTDTVTITVSAKDTGGGIDEIRLYHNGKAIGEDTRAVKIVPKGNEAIKTYTVTLVDGANTFRAVGFSKDRTESNPYELIVKLTAPQKDVSLYIFTVGINKYKNPALNLNYAEPDARGIVDFFKQKGEGLFKKVEIGDIYNEQATKETIISKLSQLQNTNPQDAVLIYLAGHGENINDKWYFIPHELTYPEREEDVKTKGISSDELSGYIKSIKAQKILLLIDACKSGAVLIAFRGFEDRKALSQLSRSTGVHIVAATTKDQFAAEVKELGHGVFTYILLEGLKGKAAGKGETVTVRKLLGYIEEKLPEITKKYKQEAQYPVVDSKGMDFPLVIVK